jgi:hypothetical protein
LELERVRTYICEQDAADGPGGQFRTSRFGAECATP